MFLSMGLSKVFSYHLKKNQENDAIIKQQSIKYSEQ